MGTLVNLPRPLFDSRKLHTQSTLKPLFGIAFLRYSAVCNVYASVKDEEWLERD